MDPRCYGSTQDNNAESNNNTNGAIESIDSDGYTVTSGNDSSSKSNNAGANGRTYVAWNWLAAIQHQTIDGDITSSIRHNSTAGFSLGTYTGSGNTAGDTVGHGVGGANPDVLIVKR